MKYLYSDSFTAPLLFAFVIEATFESLNTILHYTSPSLLNCSRHSTLNPCETLLLKIVFCAPRGFFNCPVGGYV